jgi:2-polyprenyl-3-methyl-5-hydroxy-6-metoxy-1,4-benzoquinol methylase
MPLEKDPQGNEFEELRNIVDLNDKNVLEIGCGDGRLTWRYAHLPHFVTGIDVDQNELHQARLELPPDLQHKLDFACSDSKHTPFPQHSFDVAIFAWSL